MYFFSYFKIEASEISEATVEQLLQISRFKKLKSITFANIPVKFDFPLFATFMDVSFNSNNSNFCNPFNKIGHTVYTEFLPFLLNLSVFLAILNLQ